jgi:hypothetical protein
MENITIKSVNEITGFSYKNNCYKCIFRGSVPGSTHSCCNKQSALIKAGDHGIKNGWVMFPFDFDPIWIIECDSFVSKEKVLLSKKEISIKLLALLQYLQNKLKATGDKEKMSTLLEEVNSIKDPENFLENSSIEDLYEFYVKIMKI